ncbi:MAG: NAD(P)/FAD-dependent oxidoreductase [Pseudomonadota bacterium]
MMEPAVSCDVAIIGAGPAGGHCALLLADAGLHVRLIDEASEPGGQIWRAPLPGMAVLPSPDHKEGEALREALRASTVELMAGHRVWSVGRADCAGADGFTVCAVGPEGPLTVRARRLVAATGAFERVVPFQGWTLPGVMGLAAATILMKSHGVVPEGPVVVAGAGPLLFAVAASLTKLGEPPAAVVDMDRRRDWLRRAPGLASAPRLMARGLRWMASLVRAGVPVVSGASVRAAHGSTRLQAVEIGPVDRSGAPRKGSVRTLEAHSLTVGHGLTPGGEVAGLLGASRVHDPVCGGWVTETDEAGRTSVPGFHAIGDCAAVRGAVLAETGGKLCAHGIAQDLRRPLRAAITPLRKAIRRQSHFADVIGRALALRDGQVEAIPSDVIVCRCEDVTRSELDAAVDRGGADVNQVKHFSRCGMGPCQGRVCGEVAATLIAQRLGLKRPLVGLFTPRPPLRPVTLDDLVGDFTYNDIPIPAPAPL